jgi:CheY-like chemotaxis protein
MNVRSKILIVEDEAPVAMLIRILPYQEGCSTEIATSVSEALKIARKNDFELITLAVGTPGTGKISLSRHRVFALRGLESPSKHYHKIKCTRKFASAREQSRVPAYFSSWGAW